MLKRRHNSFNYFLNNKKHCSKKNITNDNDNELQTKSNMLQLLTQIKPNNDSEQELNVFSVNNHIYFRETVTSESIDLLIDIIQEKNDELIELKKNDLVKDIIPNDLILHITTDGGCLLSALRCVDYIQTSKIGIITVVEGSVSSAGTLLSIVGKQRYMGKNAYMLIHQLSSGFEGTFWKLSDEYENVKNLMEHIYDLYIKHTKLKRKELEKILEHDISFRINDCIKFGLVDGEYVK